MNNFHQSKVCWQEARGVSEISSYFRIVCKHRHLCIFAPQCLIARGCSLCYFDKTCRIFLIRFRWLCRMFLTDLSFSVYKWVLAAAGGKWVWKSWELIGTKHWIPNQVGLQCIVCNHQSWHHWERSVGQDGEVCGGSGVLLLRWSITLMDERILPNQHTTSNPPCSCTTKVQKKIHRKVCNKRECQVFLYLKPTSNLGDSQFPFDESGCWALICSHSSAYLYLSICICILYLYVNRQIQKT